MAFRILDDDVDDSKYFFDWDSRQKPDPTPRRPQKTFWTEERVAILTEFWLKGCKARAIAIKLGTTRNAVIGKADRMMLKHGSMADAV